MSKEKSGGVMQGLAAVITSGIIGYALVKNSLDPTTKAAATPENSNGSDTAASASRHAGKAATAATLKPKSPHDVTVDSHLSRAAAEKLFGVDLQETVIMGNPASNPTALEVKGIKHVAHVIGKNSYGWGAEQASCLDTLWTNESNWRGNAWNKATAEGIPQALMKVHGDEIRKDFPDYENNVVEQVQWGEIYIHNRYGNPCEANYMWHHQKDSNGNPWY